MCSTIVVVVIVMEVREDVKREREVNAADDRLFNQLISSTFPSFFFAYQAN